ncbi:MAG: FAD-dependent oxidoreductase, partial [Gaiellaceae bacterium]
MATSAGCSRATSSSSRSRASASCATAFGNHRKVKVAVIGAGVMGLATGWALRRRGVEATVYEQFEVGHA